MAAVRKDKKGRILKNGENQLKDGRYMYKYVDETGKEKYVYSWKLVATDITPKGKRKGISLREKEEQIHDSLKAGISSNGGNLTVLQLVEK